MSAVQRAEQRVGTQGKTDQQEAPRPQQMLQHTAAAALSTRHMGMLILPHHTTLEPIPALGHQWPVARCYRRPPPAAPPLPPPPLPYGSSQVGCLRLGGDLLGGGGGALPEAVLEAPGHGLEVTATASARGLSPLSLLAPVDCTTRTQQRHQTGSALLQGREGP